MLVCVLVWFNARSIDRLDEAQRRIAAENQRLAAEAKAAVAARDEFIALAGHELRTPLTAMRLRAQMDERRADEDGAVEAQRWMRLIDRLTRLVETMLDTSRLAQQRLELERRQRRSARLGQQHRGAAFRRVRLRRHHGSRRERAGSDRARRSRCAWSRRSRTSCSTRPSMARAHDVEVSLAREGSSVRLSIRDGGIGIAPADQERIFSRFERAAPASSFGGLGLGLYLVRQVMDAHGGSISVDSVPGKGATFHLRLPVAPAEEGSVEATAR